MFADWTMVVYNQPMSVSFTQTIPVLQNPNDARCSGAQPYWFAWPSIVLPMAGLYSYQLINIGDPNIGYFSGPIVAQGRMFLSLKYIIFVFFQVLNHSMLLEYLLRSSHESVCGSATMWGKYHLS